MWRLLSRRFHNYTCIEPKNRNQKTKIKMNCMWTPSVNKKKKNIITSSHMHIAQAHSRCYAKYYIAACIRIFTTPSSRLLRRFMYHNVHFDSVYVCTFLYVTLCTSTCSSIHGTVLLMLLLLPPMHTFYVDVRSSFCALFFISAYIDNSDKIHTDMYSHISAM